MRSRFNIIIPTYNNKEELHTCLTHLNEQGKGDRVCVCVDGSTDGTFEELPSWHFENLEILILHHPNKKNRGRAATRNLGLNHLIHPNTLFLDSDMIPRNDLLEQHFVFLEKHPISGGNINLSGGKWASYCNTRGIFKFRHEEVCPGNYFLTGNTAFRTACLGNVRFDERFSTFGGEDADFGLKLESAGFSLRTNELAESTSIDTLSIREALNRLEVFGDSGMKILSSNYPEIDWYRISKRNSALYSLVQKSSIQQLFVSLAKILPQKIANLFINAAVISAVQRGYKGKD